MLVYERAAIQKPVSTPVTSGGVYKAITSKPITILLVKYANLYVTSQGVWLWVHVWTLLSESGMDYW